jgi:pimeloyl-ACP methyl ester carboxylesterase
MVSRSLAALLVSLALAGCVSVPTGSGGVVSETFMIPALDPGIQLHVRNKYPAGGERFGPERIVLVVHGATFPSETTFDIDLPGGAWMDFLARRGFDAYCVDVRGYGRSTRPGVMEQPPQANPPFADTREAIRDISSAVEFILKRRGASGINLIGWSWGTTTMAGYAATNPAKVMKLVLYAPVWFPIKVPPVEGAYRISTRESARGFATAGIPKQRVQEISPPDWYDKWWAANLATDAVGASRTPPVVRSPNGVMKDLNEFWSAGKPTYDPAAIRAPTMLVVGEWDAITPPVLAQELFKQLTGAKQRRLVVLSEGSHLMAVEKNRMHLIREVQHFLEESPK